ncbi:hypothetical protein ACHAC9_00555 [Massilia sp. CMS3.1]|uniref:hypothetical protein n=1 Tax=Massilia sp. CMS3.1 TaxID=3373083 RepID=UPI003EE69109
MRDAIYRSLHGCVLAATYAVLPPLYGNLQAAASRRQSLRWLFAGTAAVPLYGCAAGSSAGTSASTTAAAGTPVYLWHCDRDGNYAMSSSAISAENYLRGVQEADADGVVTFTTIFPGCYDGRMPQVHVEVYPTLAKATSAANRVKTSQFAFPLATCNDVYTANGYSASVRNLARISYALDKVFVDGTALQMASMTGDVVNGYVATLTVGVSL